MASLEDAAKTHAFALRQMGEMIVWLTHAVAGFEQHAARCDRSSVWERGLIAEKSFGATTLRVSDIRSNRRAITKGTQTVRRHALQLTVDTLDAGTCAAILALVDSLISTSTVKTTRAVRGCRTSFACVIQTKKLQLAYS
ncbi:MAG TPA: hypothetical protein VLG40_01520 [Candidatus Saccharimonas sp.]|nr:hypothetical protein [Candidatus Saccharimonas sp.]